jgi:5-methylcytosine-specific restriction enzyme A
VAQRLLEAAHIRTRAGAGINSVNSGVLLRSDIHTLFDRRCLTINPVTLRVAVRPALMTSE